MAKSAGRASGTRATRRAPVGDENLHSGGTRATSRLGGPQAGADEDEDGRSTLGRPDSGERTGGEEAREAQPPRGPVPAGGGREDYVGGERPHKTRQKGGKTGASGRRNEVI